MNKKQLQYFLWITVSLFIYSLIKRIPDVDDAWVGELAYFQAKLGFARSELMRGLTMLEIRHICHHKFLTIQGGWFVNLFGWSLYSLKSVSLFYLFIFVTSFIYYAKSKSLSNDFIILFFSLFLANALVFEFSFIYRPEIPVMTLGFLSFIFLERSLEQLNQKTICIILSGLFAGLSVATHLNGLVFPVAGFIILMTQKKYWPAFLFGIFTLPTIAIYFYDFHSLADFKFWSYQMNNIPSLEGVSNRPLAMKILYNLLSEHMRFFHSPIEQSLTLLMLFVFALSSNFLKKYKLLLRYSFILVITIALFSIHKTSKYSIIYFPYLMLLVAYGIHFIYDNRNKIRIFKKHVGHKLAAGICTVLLLFYFSANSFFNIRLCLTKFSPKQNSDLAARYIPEKNSGLRIIAPMTFIFNEIDSFKSIQGEMYYTEMQKSDSSLYRGGFLDATKKFNIDYIILSEAHIKLLGINDCSPEILSKHGFEQLLHTDEMVILKRKNNSYLH